MQQLKSFFIYFLESILLLPTKIFFPRKPNTPLQLKNNQSSRENGFFYLSRDFFNKTSKKIHSIFNEDKIWDLINKNLDNKENELSNKYMINLTNSKYLSAEEKIDIKNLISNNEELNKEISHTLGYKCIPSDVHLILNHYCRDSREEEGSKLWHRDNSAINGQFKLFYVLNKIDIDDGGQFYF